MKAFRFLFQNELALNIWKAESQNPIWQATNKGRNIDGREQIEGKTVWIKTPSLKKTQ